MKKAVLLFLALCLISFAMSYRVDRAQSVAQHNALAGGFLSMLSPASVTPPAVSAFTWGNQGSATATVNAGGGVLISSPTALDSVAFLYKAAPAAPWTVITAFLNTCRTLGNWCLGGLVLRESSSGKLIGWWLGGDNAGRSAPVFYKYSSYTSASAAYVNSELPLPAVVWEKVVDDGTNYTVSMSADGQEWTQLYQTAINNYFTTAADEVGFGVDGLGDNCLFIHWSGI